MSGGLAATCRTAWRIRSGRELAPPVAIQCPVAARTAAMTAAASTCGYRSPCGSAPVRSAITLASGSSAWTRVFRYSPCSAGEETIIAIGSICSRPAWAALSYWAANTSASASASGSPGRGFPEGFGGSGRAVGVQRGDRFFLAGEVVGEGPAGDVHRVGDVLDADVLQAALL